VDALRDRRHDIAAVLIGSGPLDDDCERFVEERGIDNVYLPGFREDALELLPDFDVFLLPSRFEGFPITVLECLHAGVPAVAYDVGGVGEAVDDCVTGHLVRPRDNETFVDRVAVLVEAPVRRDRMGRRAKRVAAHRFTEDRMIDAYEQVYDEVVDAA